MGKRLELALYKRKYLNGQENLYCRFSTLVFQSLGKWTLKPLLRYNQTFTVLAKIRVISEFILGISIYFIDLRVYPYILDYYRLVVSFEIRILISLTLLVFKTVLLSGSLISPCDFQDHLADFCKKSTKILIDIILNLQISSFIQQLTC